MSKEFGTHDDLLEELAASLDIPDSKYQEAESHYQSLGTWLDREGSSIAHLDPEISVQGSFALGTVKKPDVESEHYDVDLVCKVNASKRAVSQRDLKQAVGIEVVAYAEAHSMNNVPEEGRRCWTINYADGTQFHMDVLPALPDSVGYRTFLESRGFREIAQDEDLVRRAIAITDRTAPNYNEISEDWPRSNPAGYALWFRRRMAEPLLESKQRYIERMHLTASVDDITASVDDIPDYKIKTPLQRSIQLLKHHRDVMFDGDEDKPISIIITTLAALAYREERTIADALRTILRDLDRGIIYTNGGVAIVSNPVNPDENFADKWMEAPVKKENFRRWLEQARADFGVYIRGSRFDEVPEQFRRALGEGLVHRSVLRMSCAGSAAGTSSAARDENSRERREVEATRRLRRTSRPWRRK